jgi:hypothetical protein
MRAVAPKSLFAGQCRRTPSLAARHVAQRIPLPGRAAISFQSSCVFSHINNITTTSDPIQSAIATIQVTRS